jgi:uncharacterized membrane protein YphA (DoxX/SURF4 family)
MTFPQTALFILTGCVFALLVFLPGKAVFQRRVSSCLQLLLACKILLSFAAVAALPFGSPDATGRLPLRGVRIASTDIGLFFLGIFLTYLVAAWLGKPGPKRPVDLPTAEVQIYYRLFCLAMAFIFIWSGLVKWIYPALDERFFRASGYGQGLFVFITVVEVLCGIGLLWRRTALYASAILIGNMAGATLTHYHNYFTRNLPDPFLNAIPSLTLQPYLIAIFVLSLTKKSNIKSTKKEIS